MNIHFALFDCSPEQQELKIVQKPLEDILFTYFHSSPLKSSTSLVNVSKSNKISGT